MGALEEYTIAVGAASTKAAAGAERGSVAAEGAAAAAATCDV